MKCSFDANDVVIWHKPHVYDLGMNCFGKHKSRLSLAGFVLYDLRICCIVALSCILTCSEGGRLLEEEVAIVHDIGFEIEVAHVASGTLHVALLELFLAFLLVVCGVLALRLVYYGEEIDAAVTLDWRC